MLGIFFVEVYKNNFTNVVSFNVCRAAMVVAAVVVVVVVAEGGSLQHSVDSRLRRSSSCHPCGHCQVPELLEVLVNPPIPQSHSLHLPHLQRVTTRLQASSLNNSAFSEPLVHLLPQHNCQVTPVTMRFNSK